MFYVRGGWEIFWEIWGHAPCKYFDIKSLWNAISSILEGNLQNSEGYRMLYKMLVLWVKRSLLMCGTFHRNLVCWYQIIRRAQPPLLACGGYKPPPPPTFLHASYCHTYLWVDSAENMSTWRSYTVCGNPCGSFYGTKSFFTVILCMFCFLVNLEFQKWTDGRT